MRPSKTQKTQPKGIDPRTGKPYAPTEIPIPTKGDFDAAMRKVAPPAGRKRLGGKDQPPGRSE